MAERTVHILLVEDDRVDAEAITRAFRKVKIANPVCVAPDGVAALQTLRGDGDIPPLPRPFLILLDLNLPRMNGIEFLDALRQDPQLHDSIVFVLTTSSAEQDKQAAYAYNIAGYLTKANAGLDFQYLVQMLDYYWCCVEFPPESRAWQNTS
jgi:CheY-like chemotaxis protein